MGNLTVTKVVLEVPIEVVHGALPESPDTRRVLRVPAKIPVTSPQDLFARYRTLLKRLDIRAPVEARDPIAAFLVVCAYSWNTISDWRERRNLIATIVGELRGARRTRLATNAVARDRLIAKIKSFREHSTMAIPQYLRRTLPSLPPNCPSPYQEMLDLTISMVETPPEDLAERMLGFVSWLRSLADFAPPVEIPGLTAFNFTPDQWRSTQARPGAVFAFTLIEMLNHVCQSQKGAVKDADRILEEAFRDVPGFMPEGLTALARARWRLRGPWNGHDVELLRFGTWGVYADLARQLTPASEA